MPLLRDVLEIRLRQTVVAVVTQKASNRDPITKLNSRLEPERGPVDKVLDLQGLDGFAPLKELFW